jgi:excisionase family DNA binding protein
MEKKNQSSLTPGALKLKPVAEYLSLSVPTMYRLVARGLLKANRSTRHLIFDVNELRRFISDG